MSSSHFDNLHMNVSQEMRSPVVTAPADDTGEPGYTAFVDMRSVSGQDMPSAQQKLLPETTDQSPAAEFESITWLKLLAEWQLEFVSCIVMIFSLAGVVVILSIYDGKAQPAWPYHVSINAVISLLIVVYKGTSLLILSEGISQLKWSWFSRSRPLQDLARFDDSSRGPLGSVKLLWELKGRYYIASLGAATTILAVLVDPFAQQVLHYHNCDFSSLSPLASVRRTNNYTEFGIGEIEGIGLPTLPLQGAVYSAFLDGDTSTSSVNISQCASDQCTFPDTYWTLGMCSECEDASPMILLDTNTSMTYDPFTFNDTTSDGTYVLPAPYPFDGSDGGHGINLDLLARTWFNSSANQYDYLGPDFPNYTVVQMLMRLNVKDNCQDHAAVSTEIGCLRGVNCKLRACARSYTAKIENGTLTETPGPRQDLPVTSERGEGAVLLSCLSPDQLAALYRASPFNVTKSSTWAFINYLNDTQFTLASLPRDCIYTFDAMPYQAIGLFNKLFFGQGASFGASGLTGINSTDVTGPIQQLVLYNYGDAALQDIKDRMDLVADGMTAHIRRNGDPSNSKPALGLVHRGQTCIDVRWAWLSLPLILGVATSVFMLRILLGRKQKGGPISWKSSALALALHGLHPAARTDVGFVGTDMATMKAKGRDLKVVLRQEELGWTLIEDSSGK